MDNKSFRRLQRKESTPSEMRMWSILRNRRFLNYKFRRQHSIGKYTVDFFCYQLMLIVEIDGSIHENLGILYYDNERDEWLKQQGYVVIRYDNESVFKFPELVMADLEKIILSIGPHP